MGTPVGDKEGPVIADVRFESALVVSGMEVKHSGTFSLTAADPSGMSRVEFRFDGNLYHTTTTASPRYTCTWDITRVADGDHLLAITAYDTLGNASTVTFNLVVALNPPQPPSLSILRADNSSTIRLSSFQGGRKRTRKSSSSTITSRQAMWSPPMPPEASPCP